MQVIEPELCPYTYNTTLPNGNRVRAGIEFGPIGQRLAYWFYPSRAGDLQDYDVSQMRRVPADSVIHLYDPLRPGQLRGVPHLTQALIKLHDLDKFDDATLLRQQLANLFVAFVKRPQSLADDSIHPLTGLPTTDVDGRPLLSLEPGIFQELAPGEDVTFSTPPDISSGYGDFMRQQLYGVAAATGVPYEVLTGDMSRVNDRTVRVIVNEFRSRTQAWQHQIIAFQFCRPAWYAWMDRVFLSGAIEIPAAYAITDPEPWAAVKWTPARVPYIHPVQDVDAQKAAIRSGFTTRSAVVSEYGEDSEEIDREQSDDNARADKLGLKYESDGRQTAAPKQPAPAPAGDGQGDGAAQQTGANA
jgi:lambda family phage portal protein